MNKKLLSFLCLILLSISLKAATNQRSDTIDLKKFWLNLNITDYTNQQISGNVKIDFTSKMNNINSVVFDLLAMTIDSVQFNNNNTTYNYSSPYLQINFPTALNQNNNASVTIFFHGHPTIDATWGGFSFNGAYAYNMGVGFSTQPHPFGRSWYPCFDNFVEHAFYEFSITTPKHYKAACNGLLQNHLINPDSTEVWDWKLNEQIVSYLAGVAVAPYATVHQILTSINSNNIPVELTALPTDTVAMKNYMNKLPQAFNTFESKFYPYQWDKVGYVVVPFNSGAMEHATNIAFGRPFLNSTYESIYPHELSHHWFGDLITCDNAGDMWLNEGWAVYCEKIFYENVYSRSRYMSEVKANHLNVLSSTHLTDSAYLAVANVPENRTYGSTVYDKGCDMIHTLRTYMGDAKFFSSLHQYFQLHQFKNSHTTQFRDSLIQYSNINLTDYFNDWILQPGFPHFSIATWQAAGTNNSTIKLSILQRQAHATHAYHNVPVSVTFFNQQWQSETHQLTVNNDGCNEFNFSLTLQNPVCAIFDYDEMLSDAITDDVFTIKNVGNKTFANGKATLNVNSITDSAMVFVAHNWIRPEGFKTPHQGLHLADRFWKVEGIWDTTLYAFLSFYYDGSTVSSTAYDKAFFGNQIAEDSLVLLYRKDATADWQIDPAASLNVQGTSTNKKGFFQTTLKKGEFTFAIYDNQWIDTALVKFQTSNCFLTNINEVKNSIINQIKIFPNPAADKTSIELAMPTQEPLQIEIFDLNGRLQQQSILNIGEKVIQLNTQNYSSGKYFLKIINSKNETFATDKFEVVK